MINHPPARVPFSRPLPAGLATVEGVLERVTFANEENGFSVVKIAVPGQRSLVTAVGNLVGVQVGESLRLTGRWSVDKKWGEQLRVESFLTVRPGTLLGIERYLGSGLVRGIGKVMARRLVEAFGLETLQVIDQEPRRLTEVEGIGPVRRARIERAWDEQREIREVMVFLQSHGVSTAHAVRIWKQYGSKAIATVRDNPYRLALDVYGIGFKTADKIARQMGMPTDSPRRAEAGVLHVLGELAGDGHVFYPRPGLVERSREILEVEPALVDAAVDEMQRSRELVVEAATAGEESPVYLAPLHAAEAGLAAALEGLAAFPTTPIAIDIERAIHWFEGRQKIALAPEQREALRQAAASKLLVITGGPGTGKTTIVNGIIQILEKKGRRILLAAPTGRAAKRMSEATGHEAVTLHRLLEFSPKAMAFQRNRDRPLEADLVVVDEASMVDTVLAYDLVKALPPPCQLVLVGDVDQLPSVGPGSVLADVIRSGKVPVVRLSHIFRQAEKSLIVVNAHRVNQGEMPLAKAGAAEPDFFFLREEEPEAVLAKLKGLVSERLPRKYGFDAVDDIQVLAPMHRGLLGAANLNAELQALLNPRGEAFSRGARTFRAGDKVMQIRNNYDLEVFNGDIGRIDAIDPEEQRIAVDFDGRTVTYEHADLDELVLAYACTVHKSQGSEYPCVILPLHTQHYTMLRRNLVYTAVTRGRKLVVVVGSARALAIAVKRADGGKRFTGLATRLGGRAGAPGAPVTGG